jgi:hypothetical protein
MHQEKIVQFFLIKNNVLLCTRFFTGLPYETRSHDITKFIPTIKNIY